MTATYIFGKRGTEVGVFIAPPAIDAATASADQLLIHISNVSMQIVQRGLITAALPQTVYFTNTGLTTPLVFLTGYVSSIPGMTGSNAFTRPRGNYWVRDQVDAVISSDHMTVEGTTSHYVGYAVLNRGT